MKIKILRSAALLMVCAMLVCSFLSCANAKNKKAVATSGEYEIPYEQLRFVTMTYKAELDARYGDGNAENGTIWDDVATAEQYRAELEELVWGTIREDYAILQACAARGIGRKAFEGKDIKKTVDQMIDDEIAQFSSKSEYKDFLEEVYATENILRFKYALDEMKYLLHASMKKDGAFLTDEAAFEEWLVDGNSAYVQHFLLYHESDEEKEANYVTLENARQKLISGEWTLTDCINRANEDTSNVAPYFLVRNVQKDALVNAAVKLREVGDVSEIVEVEGALYVLVRMEETPILGANGTTETPLSLQLSNLLSTYQWAIVGDAVKVTKENLNIELNDYGKSIDLVTME
ncbi:MAG: hypothetical protein E7584_05430 [Ruminococcaceae bacterium]|nr:hypothetical protein [Oscillospiraceae bacterium]